MINRNRAYSSLMLIRANPYIYNILLVQVITVELCQGLINITGYIDGKAFSTYAYYSIPFLEITR